MEYWYDWPMQVKYWRNKSYSEGIVYHDSIVDLMDGAPSKLGDILYMAKLQGISEDDAVVEWADWADLTKAL